MIRQIHLTFHPPNFPTILYVNMSLLKGQYVSIKVVEVLITITNQCDVLTRSTKCIEHLSEIDMAWTRAWSFFLTQENRSTH